jgi:hypothetical protein
LITFQAEHHANTLLLKTLQAYHFDSSPSTPILTLSRTAITELRKLIILPTAPVVEERKKQPLGRSMTTKAPAVKVKGRTVSEPKGKTVPEKGKIGSKSTMSTEEVSVFEDLRKLASLLGGYFRASTDFTDTVIGSLASLLGMMGHALAKVEALKLLRALLRGREDLVDGTSAKLFRLKMLIYI